MLRVEHGQAQPDHVAVRTAAREVLANHLVVEDPRQAVRAAAGFTPSGIPVAQPEVELRAVESRGRVPGRRFGRHRYLLDEAYGRRWPRVQPKTDPAASGRPRSHASPGIRRPPAGWTSSRRSQFWAVAIRSAGPGPTVPGNVSSVGPSTVASQ